MNTTQTATIDQADYVAVVKAVEKANRRAAKIGVPGYVLSKGAEGTREITAPDPAEPGAYRVIGTIPTIEVTVIGEAPRYADWSFVATVDWVGDDAIIRKVRGLEELDTTAVRAGLTPNGCDHCHAARDRNNTYLLRHDTEGTWRQVGSTCLRDFLGVEVNLALIGWNPYEGCDSENRYEPEFLHTLVVLADTLAVVRAYGWVSAGQAYNDPSKVATKVRLLDAYTDHRSSGPGAEVREAIREYRQDGDAERAAAILDWIRSAASGASDYALNLRAAVGTEPRTPVEVFRIDHLAIVASAVASYNRQQERNAATAAVAATSTHQGEVGKRLTDLTLTVRSTRWIESAYGPSLLVLFADAAGNVYKWFASNPPTALEQAGTVVRITGTVKAHEVYNGLASTVLTRCKVAKEVSA